MGNQSKVTHVAIGGAVATIIIAVLGAVAPDALPDQAGLEAAIAVIATAVISYVVPA